MRGLGVGLLVSAFACGSSEAEPIDPVAVAYCAAVCSDLLSCERVVNEMLAAACPVETRAWYVCVTDNACDETACDTEWAAREACEVAP